MTMYIRPLPIFTLVLLMTTFLGCDHVSGPTHEGALAPETVSSSTTDTYSASKNGSLSATGGAHFTVPPDVFGAEVGNVLTFNARKDADGQVSGQYNYHQTFQGELFKFNGRVTCVNVYDGNRAKIGGIIDVSNDPTIPVGTFIWWSVIDNGQGAGSSPDQSTLVGVGDEAANEAFCDSPALPRFGPWDVQGNFQVN